ncbi:hypothetical protein PVAP13_2KG376305 [Panicum virgatum]|uniref:Uncharacterized protein n=1 Tax=Panicum virgatum TaxID=38727 RepID=A0A8T0WC40_PANVG|nr:hypothetical protein PVAP13_2KG376305 [Panicum virgatum]
MGAPPAGRPARPPHPRWERRRAPGPCAPSSPAALGARATGPSASTPPLRAVLGEQATGLSASAFPCAGSAGQDARRTAASLRGARKKTMLQERISTRGKFVFQRHSVIK